MKPREESEPRAHQFDFRIDPAVRPWMTLRLAVSDENGTTKAKAISTPPNAAATAISKDAPRMSYEPDLVSVDQSSVAIRQHGRCGRARASIFRRRCLVD